jgi:hypothetical protein
MKSTVSPCRPTMTWQGPNRGGSRSPARPSSCAWGYAYFGRKTRTLLPMDVVWLRIRSLTSRPSPRAIEMWP